MWRAAKEDLARRRRAHWPTSVRAAVDEEGAPTPSLADFLQVYDEDDNVWWRLSCGHHQNLLDEALERLDELGLVVRVLALWSDEDLDHEDLLWSVRGDKVTLAVMCSDFFTWGTADSEGVDEAGFPVLAQAVMDAGAVGCEDWGARLYAARRRRMRPQGACYEHIPEVLWPLFDACGPEREIDMFNPRPHP